MKEPASIARLLKEADRASRWDDMDGAPTKCEKRAFGDRLGSAAAPTPAPRGRKQGQGFGPQDLKELRKAIKANDKKIAELTAKIGKPSLKE